MFSKVDQDNMASQIAIVELGGSHEECIYSQIMFLNSAGYHVHLVVDKSMALRMKGISVKNIHVVKKTWWGVLQTLFYLGRKKITTVVINTCSGNEIRLFSVLALKRLNVTGILHNGKKLSSSSSQKLISKRVKKYFVLSDYIFNSISVPAGVQVKSLYTIFFPRFEMTLTKNPGELWIVIPGGLETGRRDYYSLLNNIDKDLSAKVKFICLGRTSENSDDFRSVIQIVRAKGLEDRFIFFKDFVDDKVFHSYIKACDIVMPLIHPFKEEYSDYKKYKISGAFNLAFAYQKPLLMSIDWDDIEDFKSIGIFYNPASIQEKLLELLQSAEAVIERTKAYDSIPKFKFEFQARNYLALVVDRR